MQLSVKYRPRMFAQVAGQYVSVRILQNALSFDRVPHALLFSGLRGTGKTTLARLFAKALNCENYTTDVCLTCPSCKDAEERAHLSIVEVDAASYNGVDDIRRFEQILQQVVLHKYRVLILDEVHMLSKAAQAALLKVLEEPPPRTVFLLVTTDPDKLASTVRSRCLSMPLKTISATAVAHNLRGILEAEGVPFDEACIEHLSFMGGGSLRDVQQLTEQIVLAAGGEPLTMELLTEAAGLVSTRQYGALADVLDRQDLRQFLSEIDAWYTEGWDLVALFIEGIPQLLRDFAMHLAGLTEDQVGYLSGLSSVSFTNNLSLSREDVRRIHHEWEVSVEMMRDTLHPRVIWELFAVKVCV